MRPRKLSILFLIITMLVSCTPQRQSINSPAALPIVSSNDVALSTAPTPASRPTQPSVPTKNPPLATKIPGGKQGQGQGQQDQSGGPSQTMSFEVPSHPYDVILGRPTANSITLSLLSAADQSLTISYGTENAASQTLSAALAANFPQEINLTNLMPDTEYLYSINGVENTFHTARAPGAAFTFTIQADSHLDSNTNTQVYEQTLANQRAENPDFFIDLGDTFMTEKYKPFTTAEPQYLAQRYLMGQLADTAPLFLVLGNHDGEGAPRGNTGTEVSDWAASMRVKYFPNPVPNDFYTGNITPDPVVGELQDYYAWTWGDALFIVLDPYWFTPPAKGNASDLWNPTLGETQYRWLENTLESSDAKWKFIFIHQLIGGADKDGRGGAEVAHFYEWGGQDSTGVFAFDQNRPNWGVPIHQLLVANHVTAVFHGHDHLFVKQELDGIIYQECPQPGAARADNTNSAAEYGYSSGEIMAGTGHIRVVVAPNQVTVDFVSAVEEQDGQVVHSYIIE
jgi:hypothetical protein